MKLERAILVAFFGNYLVNNVVAAIVALIPASQGGGVFTPQYIAFVVLAAALVAGLAWWLKKSSWQHGAIFGAIGFGVAIVTAFVSGVSGVILQTGSISQAVSVIPNFWPFLANWSTIVLAAYWVIPSAVIGYLAQVRSGSSAGDTPKPVF